MGDLCVSRVRICRMARARACGAGAARARIDDCSVAGMRAAGPRELRLASIAAASPRRGRASMLTSTRMMFDTLTERMNSAMSKLSGNKQITGTSSQSQRS
jgi:hypothetical protein